jgi:hypothetical protein
MHVTTARAGDQWLGVDPSLTGRGAHCPEPRCTCSQTHGLATPSNNKIMPLAQFFRICESDETDESCETDDALTTGIVWYGLRSGGRTRPIQT